VVRFGARYAVLGIVDSCAAQTSRIPKPAAVFSVEDSMCAICDNDESEGVNAIVFCDGCNLAVHQGGPSAEL
jgi:hypothetical protein